MSTDKQGEELFREQIESLATEFACYSSFNRKLTCTDLLKRPDFLYVLPNHVVIMEYDENYHKDYSITKEFERVLELANVCRNIHHKAAVNVLRVNAQQYSMDVVIRHLSALCRDFTPGELTIKYIGYPIQRLVQCQLVAMGKQTSWCVSVTYAAAPTTAKQVPAITAAAPTTAAQMPPTTAKQTEEPSISWSIVENYTKKYSPVWQMWRQMLSMSDLEEIFISGISQVYQSQSRSPCMWKIIMNDPNCLKDNVERTMENHKNSNLYLLINEEGMVMIKCTCCPEWSKIVGTVSYFYSDYIATSSPPIARFWYQCLVQGYVQQVNPFQRVNFNCVSCTTIFKHQMLEAYNSWSGNNSNAELFWRSIPKYASFTEGGQPKDETGKRKRVIVLAPLTECHKYFKANCYDGME